MTDRDLEQRLRAWYRVEVGAEERAPVDLRDRLGAIPRSTPPAIRRDGRRNALTLLAAAAVLVGGALAAGSGLLHVPSVVVPPPTDPAPTSAAIATASPSTASPSPTPDASPTATPPLGGGLILVRDVARGADGVPLDTVHGFGPGSYDVYTLDAASGARTKLGTVPYDWTTGYTPELRWASDRTHVLFSDRRGKVWALGSPTAAGQRLVRGMLRATWGRRLGLLAGWAADRGAPRIASGACPASKARRR